MKKNDIPGFIVLMVVWVILMGDLSAYALVSAPIVSFICLVFLHKFLPLAAIQDVAFFRLIFHYLSLIGKIYLNAFYVIKIIFTKGMPEIVEVHTALKNDFLRAVLIHSITLTPGSIPLNLDKDTMTVLNLADAKDPHSFEDIEKLRASIERNLLKCEKKPKKVQDNK